MKSIESAYRVGCAGTDCRFLVGLVNCLDATGEIVDSPCAGKSRESRRSSIPSSARAESSWNRFVTSAQTSFAFVDAGCATLPNEMLQLAQTARQFDGAIASRRLRLDDEWRRAVKRSSRSR